MSSKLRELIKKVRACKTAEEERSVINKESAEMRNMSREAKDSDKCRNLNKCIYMHMMGYSTTFIHVTTVNLLASQNFGYKRMAYLSLCLVLDEKSEVLLLSTQTIKKDLQSNNYLIVAMALNAIGEICTPEMCRELASEVSSLMKSEESFLRKKAACACSKIVRKCPELTDSFLKPLYSYLEDRNHGVLLSGLSLLVQIFQQDLSHVKKFVKYTPTIIKYLKNLISISYSPEYDVNGITDPFLQAKLVETLQYFGKDNPETSEEMRDILSSVSTAVESSKPTGSAILYELVRTINNIVADTGLKSLASNILGKFLSNRDNNYKYIALNTLREVVKVDPHWVQKHKHTILSCLKDNDISIKRRALDLVYLIVNPSNVKSIVKEVLNYLMTTEDRDIKLELTTKISQSIRDSAPSVKWQIDTSIKMLCLSASFVSEETVALIIHLILSSDEFKLYSVHKCFLALKNNKEMEGLAKVAIYVIGEFGDVLVANSVLGPDDEDIMVTEEQVLSLLEEVQLNESTSSTAKEYLMNCYYKLSSKGFPESRIKARLQDEVKSYNCEVQQRAVEYITSQRILNTDLRREITKQNPKVNLDATSIPALDDQEEDIAEEDRVLMVKFGGGRVRNQNSNCSEGNKIGNIFDLGILNVAGQQTKIEGGKFNLLDIFGTTDFSSALNLTPVKTDLINMSGEVNSPNTNQTNIQTTNLLSTNFDSFSNSTPQLNNPLGNFDLLSLNNLSNPTPVNNNTRVVYSNTALEISYTYDKNFDGSINGCIYVTNKSDKTLSNVNLKFMVIRTVNLKVLATSGSMLNPKQHLGIKKDFHMVNNDTTKKIVLKVKYSYTEDNFGEVTDTITIDDFN